MTSRLFVSLRAAALLTALTTTALTTASAQSGTRATPPSSAATSAPALATAQPATSTAPLQPGDVLRLRVWREPDWSGDFPVAPDGTVVLARLGSVRIDTVTTDRLATVLQAQFGVYLRDPVVEVLPLRRVGVYGAVSKPGLYLADPTMGPTDVAGLAGGALPDARRDRVVLERAGTRRTVLLTEATRAPLQSGDRITVPERGWFAQNFRWFLPTIGSIVASLIITSAR